jgi:hypothetical protein
MAAVLALSVVSATSASAAAHRVKVGRAGAAVKSNAGKAIKIKAVGAEGAAIERKAAVSAAKKTATGTGAQLEVCKIARTSALVGASPFLEANWSGSFGTAFSLTGASSPGHCGKAFSYRPGSVVLVEEASSPGVAVPLVNASFGFTNGTVDALLPNILLAAVTVKAGLNVLTVTDTDPPPTSTSTPGTLELCKSADDRFVQGDFTFQITGSGFNETQSVLTGQCDDISLPSGTVTVTEQQQFPYALASVSALPSSSLISSDLDTQSAQIDVLPGGSSTVFFSNATLTGYVKVCKTLARSQDDVLAGQTFNFSVSASFDGATVTAIPSSVSVVASDYPTVACSFLADSSGMVKLPLGTLVTVTETGLPPTIQTVGTSVSPANLDAGSTTSTAQFYVGNQPPPNNVSGLGSDSVTQATFTNEAYGYVEVCKVSSTIDAGISFSFSIGGLGAIPPVETGYCGAGQLLPVGTATVTETPKPHVTLQSVSGTSGATQSGNSATVNVPYNAENVVTFDNEINTGTLKICKAQTSSDAGLQGTAFALSYAYSYNGQTVNGPVSDLKPGQCTLPVNGIPVLNSNLNPVVIYVNEQTTTVQNVGVFNVEVTGGDTIQFSPAPPTHLVSAPGGSPATVVLNSLEGITDVTFVNGIDITSG